MSGHPDDHYLDRRDDRFDETPVDPRAVANGRAAVRAPGFFLIFSGLIGLVACALASVPLVFDPDMMVREMKNFVAQQPPGQQKKDLEKQVEELENEMNQDRNQMVLENAAELGVMAVMNLLAIVGGFTMRGLGSYGLSMAGAIVSLIPCVVGCCPFLGLPAGIWALVVLSRADVKAAFAAKRSVSHSHPDDHYMR